ncbi:MAG: beta-lactamase family protein [Chloroflexi bacterium]|jgi:CubicO group peptidase (beta-lactamase class C family)|nr:beta-lactamase family protein [Chloroflexota bacterium]
MPVLRLDPDRLQPAFDALAARVESGVVSAAVLAVGTSDGLVRDEAFGMVGEDLAGVDDRFYIASITKPIVATAVVQLAAEGRISLREPLRTYLPDLSEGHAAVTAWHVLTHTSGIPDDPFGGWDGTPRDELVRRAMSRPLDFAPGSRYAYCSSSFFVLGELLARADGVPFEESLRRRVLAPMGMSATSFSPTDPPGTWVPVLDAPTEGMDAAATAALLGHLASIAMPGGGLWSTAGDLLRFARAWLRGGSLDGAQLLPAAWIDLMGREQTTGIREASPDGIAPERDPRYALGWGKPVGGGDVPCSDRAVEHGGISGTRLFVDPATDLAIVVLANRWDHAETSRAVVAAVHSALVPA